MMVQKAGGGGLLPAEYQQVEYLQGNGTSTYINAGITYEEGIEVDIVLMMQNPDNYRQLFGFDSGRTMSFFIGTIYEKSEMVGTTYGGSLSWYSTMEPRTIDGKLPIKYRMIARAYMTTFYNLTTFEEHSYGSGGIINAQGRPMLIFAQYNLYNRAGGFSTGRIYSLIVRNIISNYTSRELIPCYRKVDLVAGMYDRVNGVFYTNAGTGSFIVGPDIN